MIANVPDEDPRSLALQLHVPASASFQDRRPQTLKDGDAFAVFDQHGDAGDHPGSSDGLYREDTRIISRFQLRFAGERPLLLSSTSADDSASFSADLTNVDRYEGEKLELARDLIHINRLKFISDGAIYERILIRNFDNRPHAFEIAFRFDADFADLFEVRGTRRLKRGTISTSSTSASVRFAYEALDGVRTVSRVSFDPQPAYIDATSATFAINIGAAESVRLFARAGRDDDGDLHAHRFYGAMRSSRRVLSRVVARAATLTSSNATFDEIARRALSDLSMLVTQTPDGPYPFAGIPWFATPFGRDGIITALFTLWLEPELAAGVLRFLAATQATDVDPRNDAEPGKILHEMRSGEMARLGEVPFARYYGSVDATPLFVMLLGAYYERTGDLALVRRLWPNACAALAWIDRYGDLDGDGFVEYERKSSIGLENQGWKDSHDAIFHADGTLAPTPIALCEVQAYVFAARRAAAMLAAALGHTEETATQTRRATEMRDRFEAAFWCEELETYALALDGNKRPCKVVASNAGHALYCGIASDERAARVAKTLFASASFSGWGVRTVSTDASRYNPMSYHNGSVWPHDNAIFALGLARYGFKTQVARLFEAMTDAASYMDLRRLPELFCGFARRARNAPTRYPVACSPQAWASAAPFAMLNASLGLVFDADERAIRFDRPVLPKFIDMLRVRRLRLGDAEVDVYLRRREDAIALSVAEQRGDVRVGVVF